MNEVWREIIHAFIKIGAQIKMRDESRKMINGKVKCFNEIALRGLRGLLIVLHVVPHQQLHQRRREVVQRVIKLRSKDEKLQLRKMINASDEIHAENQERKGCRKIINALIEAIAKD